MNSTVLRRAEIAALILAFIGDAVATYLGRHSFHAVRFEISLVVALIGIVALLVPANPQRPPYGLFVALIDLPAIAVFNPRLGFIGVTMATLLVVRYTFAFGLRGAAVAGFSAFVAVTIGVLTQIPTNRAWIALFPIVVIFGTLFGFIALLINTLRSENAARRELEDAHAQLRSYAERSAEIATIEERSRVALDLHDALGHGLTTLSVQLQSATRLREHESAKADEFVTLASATATSLLADLRETVAIMRSTPEAVDRFSDRVERTFTDFAQSVALVSTWDVRVEREPNSANGLLLLRFVQEALTNVARHAAATHLTASVIGDTAQIVITISDDGRGFSVDAVSAGTGLASMRERLASAGGTIRIASSEASGTTITASVPLEHE